jgi:transposase-like protein
VKGVDSMAKGNKGGKGNPKGSNNGGGPRNQYYAKEIDKKLPIVEGWARDGATIEQIAINIGIRRETLYKWMRQYPELKEAIDKGREITDRRVENALYNNAMGQEVWEETQELRPIVIKGEIQYNEDGTIKAEMVTVERKKKFIPGSATAQIFWLKNRKSNVWRDKQEVQHSGNIGLDVSYLSDDDLEKELKRLEALENGNK